MTRPAGKNWANLQVEDGGTAAQRRTHAEKQLERDLRALFVALRGKDGKALNRNYSNVAKGHVRPWRVLVRRIKEAKAMRAPKGYEHSKAVARRLGEFVDDLYDRRNDTGDFPKVA